MTWMRCLARLIWTWRRRCTFVRLDQALQISLDVRQQALRALHVSVCSRRGHRVACCSIIAFDLDGCVQLHEPWWR